MQPPINTLSSPINVSQPEARPTQDSPTLRAGDRARFDRFHPETRQQEAGSSGTSGKDASESSHRYKKGALASAASTVSNWLLSSHKTVANLALQTVSSADTHTADKVDPKASSVEHINNTAGLARQHGCELKTPFSQSMYLREQLMETTPSLIETHFIPKDDVPYACLGLSMTWAKHHEYGMSSDSFFNHLNEINHNKDDRLLNDILSIQHKEQKKYRNKPRDAFEMFQGVLPLANMTMQTSMTSADEGLYHHHRFRNDQFPEVEQKYLKPGSDQTFILLSPLHAMAMHKSADGKMEFFDPQYGVVTADNTAKMFSFLKDVQQRDVDDLLGHKFLGMRPSGNIFQLTEVVADPPRRQPQRPVS